MLANVQQATAQPIVATTVLHMMDTQFAKKVRRRLGREKAVLRQKAARAVKGLRLRLPVPQKPHGLPSELIVSLTSYPPRFTTLYPTLVHLLVQTVRANRIVLWVAPEDQKLLPGKVRRLVRFGLEIREAVDTGSYKKIVPALQAFPGAFIVTADDDIDYDKKWLEELLKTWDGRLDQIAFHRRARNHLEGGWPAAPLYKMEFLHYRPAGRSRFISDPGGRGPLSAGLAGPRGGKSGGIHGALPPRG